jgi:hypothetical protein
MAVPATNIEIEQGADFTANFTITNTDGSVFDMEDGTAVAKMKKFPTAGTAYTFTAGITTSTGIITLEMTDTVTTDIPAGRYYYDILLTMSDADKVRVHQGMALVTAGIS